MNPWPMGSSQGLQRSYVLSYQWRAFMRWPRPNPETPGRGDRPLGELVSRTLQRQHIRSLSWARPEALSHPLWLRLRSSIQKRKQADIPVLPATNSGREQRLNRRSAGESTGVCHKPGALGQWQGLSKGHTTCHTNGEHSYAGVEIGGGDQGGAWRYDCSLNGSSTTKGGSCLGQSLIRCD
jgi:hypothetical protein